MKLILFLTFLMSLCKGGLWITFGILLRNHFETVLSMIIRKPVPDGLISQNDNEKTNDLIKIIGLLLIIIGVVVVAIGLFTWITGVNMSNNKFNFRF